MSKGDGEQEEESPTARAAKSDFYSLATTSGLLRSGWGTSVSGRIDGGDSREKEAQPGVGRKSGGGWMII